MKSRWPFTCSWYDITDSAKIKVNVHTADFVVVVVCFCFFFLLVSWCFEPSQPQWITSGLNTNFTLSLSYSLHKSLYHKSSFFSLFIFRGHSTQEPCVSHGQHRRNRERCGNKCRWMDRKVEISMEEILAVSVACMAIHWPTPGFKVS